LWHCPFHYRGPWINQWMRLVKKLVLVLVEELPVAPLGPLRKCLHPGVLHTSILTPTLTLAMLENTILFLTHCGMHGVLWFRLFLCVHCSAHENTILFLTHCGMHGVLWLRLFLCVHCSAHENTILFLTHCGMHGVLWFRLLLCVHCSAHENTILFLTHCGMHGVLWLRLFLCVHCSK
jgi:hypothetical protein